MKPNRANGEKYALRNNRIIEVDEERGAVLGEIGNANELDMKYEMFCKWLQQNEQNPMLNADHDQIQLTEDEVSSFATNSDDSGSDVFLDTESDYPIIVLSSEDHVPFSADADFKLNNVDSIGEFRVDTPSQLSVSDYDCSSSDVTVNSKVSATSGSSSQAKRKAKHRKGRAPPIPIATLSNHDGDNNWPFNTRSARETDI